LITAADGSGKSICGFVKPNDGIKVILAKPVMIEALKRVS
jgi:hypothetical protein